MWIDVEIAVRINITSCSSPSHHFLRSGEYLDGCFMVTEHALPHIYPARLAPDASIKPEMGATRPRIFTIVYQRTLREYKPTRYVSVA